MKKLKLIITFILLISLFLGVVACTPDEESKAESTGDVSVTTSDEVSEEESEEEIIEVSGDFETIGDFTNYCDELFSIEPPYPSQKNDEYSFLLDGFREAWPYHTENRDTLTLKAIRDDGRELKVIVIPLTTQEEYSAAFEKRYPDYESVSDSYVSWMGGRIRSIRVLKAFAEPLIEKFEKVNPLPKENCYTDIDQVFHFITGNNKDHSHTLRILAYVNSDEIAQLEKLPMVDYVGSIGSFFSYHPTWCVWTQCVYTNF